MTAAEMRQRAARLREGAEYERGLVRWASFDSSAALYVASAGGRDALERRILDSGQEADRLEREADRLEQD